MTPAELLGNLGAFTLQLAAVVAAAGLLERMLPVDHPRARLAYWQSVLALGLVLPLVQPWRVPPPASFATSVTAAAAPMETLLPSLPMVEAPLALSRSTRPAFDVPRLLVLALALGAAAAAGRLLIAAAALRRVRRRSRPLPPTAAISGDDLRLSADIASPVTFGLRRPMILLPDAFAGLKPEEQRSVVCHERVHVERRDFAAHVFEELLRVALWFHPALHWLLGRLRLAREQAVDAEVVERLGCRAPYLEALVSLASAGRAGRLVPAAPFFTRSHLAERVDLLLKEERMSRTRVWISLAMSAALVALCTAGAVAMAPLYAAAPAPPAAPLPPAPVEPLDEADEIAPPAPPVAPVMAVPAVPAAPAPPARRASRVLPPLPPGEPEEAEAHAMQAELEALRHQLSAEKAALEATRQAMQQMREQLHGQAEQVREEFQRDFTPKIREEMERTRQELEKVREKIQEAAQEAAREAREATRHIDVAKIREEARAAAELAANDMRKAGRDVEVEALRETVRALQRQIVELEKRAKGKD